jgi:uncharacterized protein (DUF1499 family)
MASIAAVTGIATLTLLVLAPAGAWLGLLAPVVAFSLYSLSLFVGMLLSMVFGVIGLVRTRARTGLTGRRRAWLGTFVGAGLLLVTIAQLSLGTRSPIHDVTTNIDDPPAFSEEVAGRSDRVNGVDYPDGIETTPEVQRQLFPDLETILIDMPREQAIEHARKTALALGWTVTSVDLRSGMIEAYDTTPVFRFVDDIVIRVRSAPQNSVAIDVRSNSRVGGGDLAANANRIRAFRDALER